MIRLNATSFMIREVRARVIYLAEIGASSTSPRTVDSDLLSLPFFDPYCVAEEVAGSTDLQP